LTVDFAIPQRVAASTAWNGLRSLWLGLFALTACLLLYAVTRRLYFPYPLEWLEAASVDMAERLLAGLPIFSAPSIAYVAPMKTPLYYYLMAAVWPAVGNGFVAGRLISILATLGTLGVIWHFVRSEGGSRIWALFGIAFYMATFQIGGQWYDIARLDAAFLFFAMAGLYGLRFWRGSLGTAGAGVLLAAAFFTKQTILMVAVPVWIALAIEAPRRALIAGLVFAGAVAGGMVLLDVFSGGWSTYFLVEVPGHGALDWTLGNFEHLLLIAPALVLSTALVIEWYRTRREAALYHCSLLFGALFCSLAGRLHFMGALNSFMPLYAVLAVLMPLALQKLEHARHGHKQRADAVALAQVALLASTLLFTPWAIVPSQADRAVNDHFLAFLRSIECDVLVMDDRYFSMLAGKSTKGLDSAARDLLLDQDGVQAAALRRSMIDALRSGRFAGIVDPPAFVRAAMRLESPRAVVGPFRPSSGKFRPRPKGFYRIVNPTTEP
jgi:dolichyl-phosphate-mannose-protein mannosyltransferase